MEVSLGAALLLSALAGLSTTLVSLAAILVREPGSRFMSLTLGFSAGARSRLGGPALVRRWALAGHGLRPQMILRRSHK